MTTEHRIATPGYVPAADRGSEVTLSLPLAVLLHLLPGALLMGAVLLLAPPLIERGVPYEVAHIASAMLTMVPFMFGAMLLHGRLRHGRFTLRGAAVSAVHATLAVRGALRAHAGGGLRDTVRHPAP